MTWFPEEFGESKVDRERNLAEWMDVAEQEQEDEGDIFGSDKMPGDTAESDEGLEEDLTMGEQGMHIEEFLPGIDQPVTRDVLVDPLLDQGLLLDENELDPEPLGVVNSDDELAENSISEEAFQDDDILAGETTDDADVMVTNTAPDETDVDEDEAVVGQIIDEGQFTGTDLKADAARDVGNDTSEADAPGTNRI